MEYGGVYLDLDVYTIRSYDVFLRYDTVLGIEGDIHSVARQGLCNGLIVSRANSTFLRRWYESYRAFDDANWSGLSVRMPLRLAMDNPEEVLVMDPYTFFYPLWNDAGLKMVHSR